MSVDERAENYFAEVGNKLADAGGFLQASEAAIKKLTPEQRRELRKLLDAADSEQK